MATWKEPTTAKGQLAEDLSTVWDHWCAKSDRFKEWSLDLDELSKTYLPHRVGTWSREGWKGTRDEMRLGQIAAGDWRIAAWTCAIGRGPYAVLQYAAMHYAWSLNDQRKIRVQKLGYVNTPALMQWAFEQRRVGYAQPVP